MEFLSSALSFIAVIIVLVMAHELGHFLTAKARGVKVLEFGLFFPPRLLSFKKGDTVYSLNLLPLGGFVKMAGEEDPDIPGSLASKGIWTRLLVLSSGALMNFILPIVLFTAAFMLPYDTVVGRVVVDGVGGESPAAAAGIVKGDIILSINGRTIENTSDLRRNIDLNLGSEITLVVERASATQETFKVIPRWQPPADQGPIGILIHTKDAAIIKKSEPIWKAVPLGFTSLFETFTLFKNSFINMIAGNTPAEVAGPVGIAQMTGEIAQVGISPLLEFAAFLSINLGIINLLPLPALDGGRIAFVLLEWVRRGKRISAKAEGMVHLIGFAILLLLVALVTYKDILRIISGDSIVP